VLANIEREPHCNQRAGAFDEVWTIARHERLVAHIEQVGSPFAEGAIRQLDSTMEAHRAAWQDSHGRACARQFELGLACLERELIALDEMLSSIESSTPEALAQLEHQLVELRDPRHCETIEPLAKPPLARVTAGPALARYLDHARFALAAEDFAAAGEHAEAAVILATSISDEAARAEAFELYGRTLAESDRYFGAEEALVMAVGLDVSPEARMRRIRARQHLALLFIEKLEDPTRARRSLSLAGEELAELDEPQLQVEQLVVSASLAGHESDHRTASILLLRASEQLAAELGQGDPRVESIELRRANELAAAGQARLAEDIYRQLLEARRMRLGAEHPALANVEFDLGLVLLEPDPDTALTHFERARELERQAYGVDSLKTASSSAWLAELYWRRGDLDAAKQAAAEAWPVQFERLPPGHSERGNALGILAWVQLELGEHAEALQSFEHLPVPSDPDQAATRELNIGWLLCRLGRCAEATPHLRVALASQNPAIQLSARLTLAEVRASAGEINAAIIDLEKLKGELEAHDDPDGMGPILAEARWLLARVLAGRGHDARVLELATAALQHYREVGWPAQIIQELESLVTCLASKCGE
jgi:tetratricopeptide (TPR) repeat protein